MTAVREPLKLLYCAAPEDDIWCDRITKHLSDLRRQELIAVWDKRLISPGSDWQQERAFQLSAADIILLLISPDFLASEE